MHTVLSCCVLLSFYYKFLVDSNDLFTHILDALLINCTKTIALELATSRSNLDWVAILTFFRYTDISEGEDLFIYQDETVAPKRTSEDYSAGLSLPMRTIYPKKYAPSWVWFVLLLLYNQFLMNSHILFTHISQGCFTGSVLY